MSKEKTVARSIDFPVDLDRRVHVFLDRRNEERKKMDRPPETLSELVTDAVLGFIEFVEGGQGLIDETVARVESERIKDDIEKGEW